MMLVYGDRAATLTPHEALRALTATVRAAEGAGDGRLRHDQLTSAFIQAGALAQGLADAEFEARKMDDASPLQDAAMALTLTLARKLAASLGSGFVAAGPPVAPELMAVALQPLPAQVTLRQPEGYAFYGLYPEAYLKVAAAHPWGAPPLVIGLRSIGTGLAALVAAVTNAAGIVTVRPTGHPFHREVRVSDGLRRRLAAHSGPFAIVDEGPGLSGSSFGALGDLLEDLGVARERQVFLPSHDGDLGPAAEPRHRERWAKVARPAAGFDRLVADEPLADWFSDLIGPVSAIDDLSGGAWRAGRADPPPAFPQQERLKFRLQTASGAWLARFAGLGQIGEGKFARAVALHQAGFTPEPLALRRGFLLERWEAGEPGIGERAAFVAHLGRYLGFRASAFPAQAGGASPEALIEMAQINTTELLGEAAGASVAARLEPLRSAALSPCHIDGRLHRWEWLRTPDGLLLKMDAVDHSETHDLVGPQDIAWDIAGAAVEHDLTPAEIAVLCEAVAVQSRRRPEPATVAKFEFCYAAFQAGLWDFAAQAASGPERARIVAHAQRYAGRLKQPASAPDA
jgi:hypothetical protein